MIVQRLLRIGLPLGLIALLTACAAPAAPTAPPPPTALPTPTIIPAALPSPTPASSPIAIPLSPAAPAASPTPEPTAAPTEVPAPTATEAPNPATAPPSPTPPKPDVAPTAEGEAETGSQELALYPIAFELPLSAEVDGIQVNLTVGWTDRFAKERGYKGIVVAREDAAKEHAAMALKKVWRSWVSDDATDRVNVTYDQWVAMVKKGGVVLKIPAVDGSVDIPNKNQDRQIRNWELKIRDGKPIVDVGVVFDTATIKDGFATLPLDLSTKDHMNLALADGKLYIVVQFPDTEKTVQVDFGTPAAEANKLIDGQFSFRISQVMSLIINNDANVLTGRGDVLALDNQVFQMTSDFVEEMVSVTGLRSDDKPFLRFVR